MSTASNVILIETKTAGSSGLSSFDFTGISSDYTDLKIELSVRTNSTTDTDDPIGIAFNDSTSNFSYRVLTGSGTLAETQASSVNRLRIDVPTAASTSSVFCNASIYIPNYTGSTNKSFSLDAVNENNSTNAYYGGMIGAYLWANTAAITSIKFTPTEGTSFVQGSTISIYGIKNLSKNAGPKATGGFITTSGGYTYHTFYSSGTFTATQAISADVLVVAGGGGGSNYGGGGAGGYRTATGFSISSGSSIPVTVGAGGAGGVGVRGGNGGSSIFSSITSTGGGGGGSDSPGGITTGASGGSGGGGAGRGDGTSSFAGGSGNTPSTSPSQGNNGGSGDVGAYTGGGGGGAGAAGSSGNTSNAGNGGSGTAWVNGTTYAAGGGGGIYYAYGGTPGVGGSGIGGNGAYATNTNAGSGVQNTGSGGGGRGQSGNSGNGGAGIVIVRYAG